jgi:membrane dipeptidase
MQKRGLHRITDTPSRHNSCGNSSILLLDFDQESVRYLFCQMGGRPLRFASAPRDNRKLRMKFICLFSVAIILFLSKIVVHVQKTEKRRLDDQKNGLQALEIHRNALVIDGHMDTLQRVLIGGADLGRRSKDGQSDLSRLEEGGIDAQFFSVWVDPIYGSYHSARRALQLIDAMYRVLDSNPHKIELAQTASDVTRIVASGKLAALLDLEGGHAIQNDLALLRMFRRLGVICMTLTHANTNDWADAATDTPRWHGLNEFGRRVVREMNRIGMIVDVSHVSDETLEDVLDVTTKPIIASHSSCRALVNHPRNLSDDMLRAIARNGGVICINFYPEFVDQKYLEGMKALRIDVLAKLNTPQQVFPEKLDELAASRSLVVDPSLPRPPFAQILDHIDHAVRIAGIDHVGIGSDMDVIPTPEGMDDVTDFPKLTRGLLDRGYTQEEINKVLGGNLLRVLQEVAGPGRVKRSD